MIRIEQRFADRAKTRPIDGWFNVYEGSRCRKTIHARRDGRWDCGRGPDVTVATKEEAATMRVEYEHELDARYV